MTAGALRLAFADVPQPEDEFFLPGYLRAWLMFLALLRTLRLGGDGGRRPSCGSRCSTRSAPGTPPRSAPA